MLQKSTTKVNKKGNKMDSDPITRNGAGTPNPGVGCFVKIAGATGNGNTNVNGKPATYFLPPPSANGSSVALLGKTDRVCLVMIKTA